MTLSTVEKTINHALLRAKAYSAMNDFKTKEDIINFVNSATSYLREKAVVAKRNEMISIINNKPSFVKALQYLSDFILAGEGLRVI